MPRTAMIQGPGVQQTRRKETKVEWTSVVCSTWPQCLYSYLTLNCVTTLIVCLFDEKLRLRSDGTKALTDSRALGVTGKGSRGELTSRL